VIVIAFEVTPPSSHLFVGIVRCSVDSVQYGDCYVFWWRYIR
jgi:hypothetical protein